MDQTTSTGENSLAAVVARRKRSGDREGGGNVVGRRAGVDGYGRDGEGEAGEGESCTEELHVDDMLQAFGGVRR